MPVDAARAARPDFAAPAFSSAPVVVTPAPASVVAYAAPIPSTSAMAAIGVSPFVVAGTVGEA